MRKSRLFNVQQVIETPDSDSASLDLEVWCCKICQLDFVNENDQLMMCERCEGAFCIKCLNMETSVYDTLKNRPDVHWYCVACDKQAMTAIKADWEIEERCATYMVTLCEKMDALKVDIDQKADKATVDVLSAEIKCTRKLVDGANADIVQLSDRIELIRNEAEEIEKRKHNLIVKGLPECEIPDYNLDDEGLRASTAALDGELCDQLFHSIGVKASPKYVRRLGKKRDGRSRVVKVVLTNEEEKKQLLKNSPTVRKVDPKTVAFDPSKIFICPDLTILQREEDYKLREELKKRRQDDPNWIIRGKKLFRKDIPSAPDPQRVGGRKSE